DSSPSLGKFDLLILIEAQDVSDEELSRVAKGANRLVLIGEPATFPESPLPIAPGKARRFGAPRPGPLARLWDALHCDPRRLPYSWFHTGDRLCCRLRPITSAQRPW